MTESPIPADAIAALLAEPALPASARLPLAEAKTYTERCLALHGLINNLPLDFVKSFNDKHGTLLANATTTAVHYLTAQGLVPPP
ncbi:hypothetical protein [Arthrobacter sp. STN4]|uniref:hypothetical protein n=1 Tax=Arthrobacter sp. STN4 TaxID=2923276 RepID=UPI00211A0029|nr:hypothetical protein [Arthrobacter sp. STN4]MCQ9162964.1 hypothetical protein [Arthrobacter sp. STN4]